MSFICFILSSFFPVQQFARIFILGLVLVGFFAPLSILSASERTGWFSDVPLTDSFTVDAKLSFAFDSPSGRILVLHLQTQAADKDIRSSYRDTLAALGWAERDGQYVKGTELLKLEKIQLEGKPSWRLTIIPLSANQLTIR
tara:strand:- start:817 stop:1242 length:426 start_codon:yes stop_codon:yes gene_type:complete